MKLWFVGDGEHDGAAIPRLVASYLACPIDPEFTAWASATPRLHKKGYPHRLQFMIRQARDKGVDGIVATVDADKSKRRARLQELKRGRDEDRTRHAPFPTALGEADPHLEAWLLDDEFAVRQALKLDSHVTVPNVRSCAPKSELDGLIEQSSEFALGKTELRARIAGLVDLRRCAHCKKTGLAAFTNDLDAEIGSIRSQ